MQVEFSDGLAPRRKEPPGRSPLVSLRTFATLRPLRESFR
jgi:hypothetical protein